jgi:hypothetical protein
VLDIVPPACKHCPAASLPILQRRQVYNGFTLSKATLDVLLLTFKRCDINACR